MIYLLKFGASWVLPPGIFFLAFFFLAWRCWRAGQKRIASALAVLTFLFYLLSTSMVADFFLSRLEAAYEPPADPQGDVIIMLGGGATQDTPDVDGQGELCSSPANRLLTTVRLQKKLGVPIILSGGQVYADSGAEARIAQRVLLSLGVNPEDIIIETKSLNTSQNARYSKEIMEEYGFQRPIVVTSAFHMRRAALNFRKVGVKIVPYPADYQVNRHPVFHYTKLRPQTEALLNNVTVLQEDLRMVVTKYIE